jgi:hypothetical protein
LVLRYLLILLIWSTPISSDPKTYFITTKYQDKFLVKEKLVDGFPDLIYDFALYNANQTSDGKVILSLRNILEREKEINILYNDDNIRSYLVSDHLVYKLKGHKSFSAIAIYKINNLNINEYKELVPAVKTLFLQNWNSVTDVLEFLVKSKDPETIATLKRYKNNSFNETELNSNMHSAYSKEEMQKIATNLLTKYNF